MGGESGGSSDPSDELGYASQPASQSVNRAYMSGLHDGEVTLLSIQLSEQMMRHAHCIATQSLHRRPAAVSAYVRQHLQHTQTNVIRIGRAYSAWRVAIRYAVGGITVFHPNVTALCSGLRYRKSVCRLITFVRPNRREQNRTEIRLFRLSQGVETFGNISSPFCTFAVLWHPCKIL